jgi:hypothetical protein
MLFLIIKQTIISIILILVMHYIYDYFKNNLTIPKVKDLVNKPKEQYREIYESIKINIKRESNENTENNDNMKSELKKYLKELSKTQNVPSALNDYNSYEDNYGSNY